MIRASWRKRGVGVARKKNKPLQKPRDISVRTLAKVILTILMVFLILSIAIFLSFNGIGALFTAPLSETWLIFSLFTIIFLIILVDVIKFVKVMKKKSKEGKDKRGLEKSMEKKVIVQVTKKTIPGRKIAQGKKDARPHYHYVVIFVIGVLMLVVGIVFSNAFTMVLAAVLSVLSLVAYRITHPHYRPMGKIEQQMIKDEDKVYGSVEKMLKQEAVLHKQKQLLEKQIEEVVLKAMSLEQQKEKLLAKSSPSTAFKTKDASKARTSSIPTTMSKPAKPTTISPFKTDVDIFYEYVLQHKKVKLSEAAAFLRVDAHILEEWGKILEEHNLVHIHYPAFGELEFHLPKQGAS